jgi:hypothetical protein
MIVNSKRPTLTQILALKYLEPFVEKKLIGGCGIHFGRFLAAGLWLYASCAVLGRARRDHFEILSGMISASRPADHLYRLLSAAAAARIGYQCGQPESFFDLFMRTEYMRWGLKWPPPDLESAEVVRRLNRRRLSAEQAHDLAEAYALEGIGLGARFPELTENIWRRTFQTAAGVARICSQSSAIGVESHFTPVTLEERERDVLREAADYAAIYNPALVGRFRLAWR